MRGCPLLRRDRVRIRLDRVRARLPGARLARPARGRARVARRPGRRGGRRGAGPRARRARRRRPAARPPRARLREFRRAARRGASPSALRRRPRLALRDPPRDRPARVAGGRALVARGARPRLRRNARHCPLLPDVRRASRRPPAAPAGSAEAASGHGPVPGTGTRPVWPRGGNPRRRGGVGALGGGFDRAPADTPLPDRPTQGETMRDDLRPGNPFPDLRLPETTGKELSLREIAKEQPLVLAFVRGWWCPKEQVRLGNLVAVQDEIQREYGKIAVVTVDEPYVNGAFRAGLGADFPFLSDEDRTVAEELDLLELTDELHRPYLPFTFVLD